MNTFSLFINNFQGVEESHRMTPHYETLIGHFKKIVALPKNSISDISVYKLIYSYAL